MKTAIVVNALLHGERWMGKICNLDPVEELLKKLVRLVKKENIFIVAKDDTIEKLGERIGGCKTIPIDDTITKNVLRRIHKALSSYEDILYYFIDTPLIDTEIAKKMLSQHLEEYAEYTFGEGFPIGVTPEILNKELFLKIADLLEKDGSEIGRDSIFQGLSKEINSFDIETYFSPEDLKMKRIELSTSLKRDSIIVERVISEKGFSCGFDDFRSLIKEKPALLRTVPSYVEVELLNSIEGFCKYSPIPFVDRKHGMMSYENYVKGIDRIRRFSEHLYVSFSYLGEPFLLKDIKKYIEYTIKYDNIHLIIETSGMLFDPGFSDYLADLHAENLSIIFQVDATKNETYNSIHKGDLNRVERNIRYLLKKIQENVYVQMVRLSENEEQMLGFFDIWEKEGAKVIIQKYNSYLGLLPDLSKYDLRPLERMPCWHLMRDFILFHNGDVPRCKQDINGKFLLGNIFKEDTATIWERGTQFYLDHCDKKYDKDCSKCDEYYTFNF